MIRLSRPNPNSPAYAGWGAFAADPTDALDAAAPPAARAGSATRTGSAMSLAVALLGRAES